jgi:hypothetical protein
VTAFYNYFSAFADILQTLYIMSTPSVMLEIVTKEGKCTTLVIECSAAWGSPGLVGYTDE